MKENATLTTNLKGHMPHNILLTRIQSFIYNNTNYLWSQSSAFCCARVCVCV
uniref:Uncharacterized protein n=1 Tax=Octopus bimaculoides TaxID=37653 RepID=A0A0L8GEA6_OCTBM